MNRKNKIFAGIGVAAIVLFGYFIYEYLTYVTTDNAQVEAHTLMMSAKVGGYVKTVSVVEGQKVKAGEVLVEIDSRDFENTLTQVKGELTSIEARRKDADRNSQRLQSLYSKGAVSQQQFDTASAGLSEVRAKFEALSAQVSQAELNLQNSKIRAPTNGYIARKSVEVGQLASPGVPLLGFVSSEGRWVTANFKETDIEKIRIGAHVDVKVDAVSRKSFTGKVSVISAATGSTFALLPPDNATGNFTKVVQRVPVKIELVDLTDADTEDLRVGLSAEVKISKH